MGLMLAEPGFHTSCFVEWEEYPRSTLIAAQRAGYFAPAPIWDDVTTFDAKPFAGAFDTLLAGYPCQPFSSAGQRKGADDERHLWPDVARIIRELAPGLRWVFLENVSGHVSLGLETVLRELHGMGFAVAAGLFTAAETGAPHERERVFIVAHRACARCEPTRTWASGERESGQPLLGSRVGGLADASCGRHGGSGARKVEQPRRAEAIGSGDTLADTNPDANAGWMVRGGSDGGEGESQGEREQRQRVRSWSGGGSIRSNGEMADASGSGLQGREQPGSPGERDGAAAHGSAAECGRPWVHPPGPADMAGWMDTLAVAPYLAPAASLGDLARFTSQVAAMAQAGLVAQEALEPALRRMATGLAERSRALRLLGNGVHPLAAGYAFRTLAAAHGLGPLDLATSGTRDRG